MLEIEAIETTVKNYFIKPMSGHITVEERIRKLEGRSLETTHTELHREGLQKKNRREHSKIAEPLKNNVHYWNPRREERENGKEEIFKEVRTENFPRVKKKTSNFRSKNHSETQTR